MLVIFSSRYVFLKMRGLMGSFLKMWIFVFRMFRCWEKRSWRALRCLFFLGWIMRQLKWGVMPSLRLYSLIRHVYRISINGFKVFLSISILKTALFLGQALRILVLTRTLNNQPSLKESYTATSTPSAKNSKQHITNN